MRNTLVGLHFLFAGTWLGCVIAVAVCERVLLAGDRKSHLALSTLHMRVDKLIEVPMIVGTLLVGIVLWLQGHRATIGFYIMAGAGLIAMATNFYCVGLVGKRHRAALAGKWAEFDSLDNRQHKLGAVVLVSMLASFAAGIWARGAA